MRGGKGDGWPIWLLAVSVLVCCGLPILLAAAGGLAATVGGLVIRWWPAVVLGLGLLGWAGTRALRLARGRRPLFRVPSFAPSLIRVTARGWGHTSGPARPIMGCSLNGPAPRGSAVSPRQPP